MANKWKCPYCANEPAMSKDDLIDHIDHNHRELIPEGWTASRLAFKIIRHKDHGTCVVCKGETEWNEKRGKYQRLCNNPACRKVLREEALKNHIKVYNCPTLLNDMEHQDKMLKGRHISGEYTFRDGGKISYVGSFEKKFLEFMDTVLECDSKDIMEPGPVLEYKYNGETHKWITDFLYIPYNLIIEVKDGGDNPNKKTMEDTRGREKSKDKMITNLGTYNYLKLTNNNFRQLMSIFADLKQQMIDDTGENKKAIVHINEDFNIIPDSITNMFSKWLDNFISIFPSMKNHPKLKDKDKFTVIKEVLSGAFRVTRYLSHEFLTVYFIVVYLGEIQILCSLILQSLMFPPELIAATSKFIYDKITKHKQKSYILPFDKVQPGYEMMCLNTHILNKLLGSVDSSIKFDLLFGIPLKNVPFQVANILTSANTWMDQWDARDFFLVDKKKGFTKIADNFLDAFNPINDIQQKDYDVKGDKFTEDSYKTNVVAVDDGVVVMSIDSSVNNEKYARFGGGNINPYGNVIMIMHEPMVYSVYGHLLTDSVRVSIGDVVKQGDIIANMGHTGNSGLPHIHFEMRYNFSIPVIAPNFDITRTINNFDFRCVNMPTVSILKWITQKEEIDKYLSKEYVLKKKAWIPEACFIKPA